MGIKDVIINFRKENKLSQREFARRCNLSNSLISILEMGVNPQTGKKMNPDFDTYKKIASGMGISTNALFEMIGDHELVSLSEPKRIIPIVVPDSERFVKLVKYMPQDEYLLVMEAFRKAEERMKEKEGQDDSLQTETGF